MNVQQLHVIRTVTVDNLNIKLVILYTRELVGWQPVYGDLGMEPKTNLNQLAKIAAEVGLKLCPIKAMRELIGNWQSRHYTRWRGSHQFVMLTEPLIPGESASAFFIQRHYHHAMDGETLWDGCTCSFLLEKEENQKFDMGTSIVLSVH